MSSSPSAPLTPQTYTLKRSELQRLKVYLDTTILQLLKARVLKSLIFGICDEEDRLVGCYRFVFTAVEQPGQHPQSSTPTSSLYRAYSATSPTSPKKKEEGSPPPPRTPTRPTSRPCPRH